MPTDLEDLKTAQNTASHATSHSEEEAQAVEQVLDLLERGAANTELETGLECARIAYIYGRIDTRKSRAVRVWEKYFPLYMVSNPTEATKLALAHDFMPRDRVAGIMTQTLTTVGIMDPAKAREDGKKICAAAKENSVFSGAIDAATTRGSLKEVYFESTQADRILTNDEMEKRLQQLYEIVCLSPPNSGYQILAIGLWSRLFDYYAHGNFSNENLREKAELMAFDLLQKTPCDSPMSRQIATSLLALDDYTPFPGIERPVTGLTSILPRLG